MSEYTVIEDSLEVYKQEFEEDEILPLLDSGFVVAVLRLNNGKIEYADINYETESFEWKEPELKNE